MRAADAAGAIAKSKYVISQHFETPWTEHAFLEPECAVAYRDLDGDIMLLTTDQSAHTTLHDGSLLLGSKKIKVQNQLVGAAASAARRTCPCSTTPRSSPT